MADLNILRGDYGIYLDGTITNDDGTVFDLTNYTLTFYAWEEGNAEYPFVSGSAEVVTGTEGTWRYLAAENDFITKGDFLCAIRATKTGAQETTKRYTLEVQDAP